MSNFTWVYFLKEKSEAFHTFQKFKAMAELEHDVKIKFLRSDNGGEYISKEFDQYLSGVGIQRKLTVPKTPEQNGTSERLNRTLVEACRTMLIESRLDVRFWAEAIATVVYLKNRSFCRSVNDTPFRMITGIRPDLNNLRVFGCKSFYHIPKDERTKLDPKGKVSIFLGYCDNRRGYRLYDETKKKVVFSRDVVFIEDELGVQDSVSDDDSNIGFCSNDFLGLQGSNSVSGRTPVSDNAVDCAGDSVASDGVASGSAADGLVDSDGCLQPPAGDLGVRRSSRMPRPPERFGEWTNMTCSPSEPTSYVEAVECSDRDRWIDAMDQEMQNMQLNNVFELSLIHI